MNTNLPLVPRTSDGPTWSNDWAVTGASRYDCKALQERGKNGKRKGQERHWNGVKNGLERGQKWVLNGIKMESRQIRESGMAKNGRSSPFHIFPAVFWPFRLFFHLFFMILARYGKKRVPKNGGTGKERTRFFPISLPFPFFTFPCLAHL